MYKNIYIVEKNQSEEGDNEMPTILKTHHKNIAAVNLPQARLAHMM